jgi:hypothetical protein
MGWGGESHFYIPNIQHSVGKASKPLGLLAGTEYQHDNLNNLKADSVTRFLPLFSTPINQT